MTEFFAFDKNSARVLVDTVRQLKGKIERLESELRNRAAQVPVNRARLLRTGKTTTNAANPSYPGPDGNTFVVKLQTWTFDETPGEQSVTRDDWDQTVIARTEDGSYVPENTHVQVYMQQSKEGRRWWIAQRSGAVSDVICRAGDDASCIAADVPIQADSAYETQTGDDVDIETAFNEFEIPLFAGDKMLLGWDELNQRYFIKEVRHVCVTAVADVWDTAPCFNKVGVCFGAPGARLPVAEETEGCTVWTWNTCDSSSAEICNVVWPGGPCNECPPSSSGGA